jgi:hypothetical protein
MIGPKLCAALLCVVLMSLTTGCSFQPPPTIEVGEARLIDNGGEAARCEIDLALSNPGDEPLELLTFEYVVTINGESAYHGRRSAEATLSGEGVRVITLPAVVERSLLARGEGGRTQWAISGSLLYVTPGRIAELLLDSGVRKPTVGFSGRGAAQSRPAGAESGP